MGEVIGWARRESWWIAAVVMVVYGLTAPGDVTGDTQLRWMTARQLAERGTVALPAEQEFLTVPGADGRRYSWYGIGQPLCLAPFVWMGEAVASVLPMEVSGDRVGQFLASVVLFPLFGAVCVWLFHRVALTLGATAGAARWSAIIFALGTMHWQYSVIGYEESQVAACWLAGLWGLVRHRRSGRWGDLLLGMAALGVSLVFRQSAAVIVLAIWVVGLAAAMHGDRSGRWRTLGRWMAAGLAGVGPFVMVVLWFNFIRFGSPVETGYPLGHELMGWGEGVFTTAWHVGVAGLIFSPGKSIFLYNPVLGAAIVGVVLLWRAGRRYEASLIAVTFVVSVGFHAPLTFWSGDAAWGPRFQTSLLGITCLALPIVLMRSRAWRRVVIGLFAVSLLIQLASTVFTFSLEFQQRPDHPVIPDGYVWRPAESHLVLRFENIADRLRGRSILIHDAAGTQLDAVNYFPFKARAYLGDGDVFTILLGAWVCGWVLLAALVWAWIRRTRAAA